MNKRRTPMDFRSITVKECFDNPKAVAIIKEMAPSIMKYPIKLFNKKTCGEICGQQENSAGGDGQEN